jgi:hypothetical protein
MQVIACLSKQAKGWPTHSVRLPPMRSRMPTSRATLKELRKSVGKTHSEVAAALGILKHASPRSMAGSTLSEDPDLRACLVGLVG